MNLMKIIRCQIVKRWTFLFVCVDRKKDCLRQFLVVLCERGDVSDLVSFDYQELEEEVSASWRVAFCSLAFCLYSFL